MQYKYIIASNDFRIVANNDLRSLLAMIYLFRMIAGATFETNRDLCATIFLCKKKTKGLTFLTVSFLLFFVFQQKVPWKKNNATFLANKLGLGLENMRTHHYI